MTSLFAAIAFAILAFSGSVLQAADAQHGRLEIRIKDHREAIGDFSHLKLKLGKIAIRSKPGFAFWKTGWRDLPPAVQVIDLTKHIGAKSVVIFQGPIEPGFFDGIHLELDGIDGMLEKTRRLARVKNLLTPISLSFPVEARGETVIVLDLVVVDMSDHPPRGYELGLKGYELYVNGKLTDKIPPG